MLYYNQAQSSQDPNQHVLRGYLVAQNAGTVQGFKSYPRRPFCPQHCRGAHSRMLAHGPTMSAARIRTVNLQAKCLGFDTDPVSLEGFLGFEMFRFAPVLLT